MKRMPALPCDVQNLCHPTLLILFPAPEPIIGKSTIQDNTDTTSGLGRNPAGLYSKKSWEVWKLVACEAKWECEEILETKGGPCREISAMRQGQDVCKSSNITAVN